MQPPSSISSGDVIATYAPEEDEASFWLARCDADCSPATGGLCELTWLETEDGTSYELGEPNIGGIEWPTIVCVVRAGWGGGAAAGFQLSQAERKLIEDTIAEAYDGDDGEAEAAASAPVAAAAPVVVGEGGEIEFVDEANTFTECTVPLRPELAGQQQKFPPKPGFELTSLRQLHQFAGTKIERLPGCVLCDKILDENSALFKSARKLIERVDATYDKWFQHFQDVESHLGPGWAKRLVFDEPFRAIKGMLPDGLVTATITVKQGGYGIIDDEDDDAAGAPKKKKKKALTKAQREEEARNTVYEKRRVKMAKGQAMCVLAIEALVSASTTVKVQRSHGKICWDLEEHEATGWPAIRGFTDPKSPAAKSLKKKVDQLIIGINDTPTKSLVDVETALKATKDGTVKVTVTQGLPDTTNAMGSIKYFQLKAEKGKVGYGWELKDDADGFCVISKLVKHPNGNPGPAACNDVPVKAKIHAVQKKDVRGVAAVKKELAKLVGKKVEFKLEKAREKEKKFTSAKHMNAMNITRRIFGVQTDTPSIYGHIPGVRLGDKWKGRPRMVCNLMMSNHMTGIHFPTWKDLESGKRDQKETVACPAIVMSGGYEDDEELGGAKEDDGPDEFWYTGDGGNDLLASGSQIKDQEDVRGNRALIRSCECKLPVRVIRGHAEADGKYNTYDGLYHVAKYTYLPGQSKHKVFRFHMKRLGGQKHKVSGTVLHKMVGNMGTKYTRWHNQYNMTDIIDVKTGKRKDKKVFKVLKRKPTEMKNVVCNDISGGQERRPIPVFNEVDNEKLPADFRYTKSSVLVGKARSFKPMHDYPSSTFERFDGTESGLLSECPCVAMTALDGRGFSGSCGEGYTSLGTIWGLRDVVFECQNCQHDTKNGLLQNRVVQNGISHHLEVFKTRKAGWGMRCFNEIPAGSFICTYEGEIMTSDECEERAKQPGMTDRYYFDLEIKSADERAAEFIAEASEEEEEDDDEEEREDEKEEQEIEVEDQMPEPRPPLEVDEPAVGASGRPSRRAAKRKQSYNEDDYYKKVGGDALVAKGRKARKAEEAQRLEQEQRAKKRKAKPKHGTKGKKSRTSTSSAASSEGTSSVGRQYAEAEYAVDGQRLGNVGRFFNHSAQPNLFMQCVHTGSTPGGHHGKYDERMPTLAFFAMKDIPPMTELTFDYGKSHAEMHKLHDNIACS